jgi:hypothetical protein
MTYISADDKAKAIVGYIIKHGPSSMVSIQRSTGLSYNQFRAGWRHVKNNYAAVLQKVAVYDGRANVYGLWEKQFEGRDGTMQWLRNTLTRLSTIEAGSLLAFEALGEITARELRGLTMLRDEFDDRVERLARTLTPPAKVRKIKTP